MTSDATGASSGDGGECPEAKEKRRRLSPETTTTHRIGSSSHQNNSTAALPSRDPMLGGSSVANTSSHRETTPPATSPRSPRLNPPNLSPAVGGPGGRSVSVAERSHTVPFVSPPPALRFATRGESAAKGGTERRTEKDTTEEALRSFFLIFFAEKGGSRIEATLFAEYLSAFGFSPGVIPAETVVALIQGNPGRYITCDEFVNWGEKMPVTAAALYTMGTKGEVGALSNATLEGILKELSAVSEANPKGSPLTPTPAPSPPSGQPLHHSLQFFRESAGPSLTTHCCIETTNNGGKLCIDLRIPLAYMEALPSDPEDVHTGVAQALSIALQVSSGSYLAIQPDSIMVFSDKGKWVKANGVGDVRDGCHLFARQTVGKVEAYEGVLQQQQLYLTELQRVRAGGAVVGERTPSPPAPTTPSSPTQRTPTQLSPRRAVDSHATPTAPTPFTSNHTPQAELCYARSLSHSGAEYSVTSLAAAGETITVLGEEVRAGEVTGFQHLTDAGSLFGTASGAHGWGLVLLTFRGQGGGGGGGGLHQVMRSGVSSVGGGGGGVCTQVVLAFPSSAVCVWQEYFRFINPAVATEACTAAGSLL